MRKQTDAAEIADLRARLTTAETERDQANACIDALEEAMFDVATFDRETGALIGRSRDDLETRVESLRAAEARVEAAEQALTEARAELVAFPGFQDANATGANRIMDAYFARAALSCPPQRTTSLSERIAEELSDFPYDENRYRPAACPPPRGGEMSAGAPDPRYFKDGGGLRPNWRYALKWPRHYAWNRIVRTLPWRYAKHLRWVKRWP